ncbi:hypothetical protein ABFY48_10255 [Lysinibacillus pakistanensis]|uniref:hypothetical protein n=1 Tax=Lysinibacillus pakistanensis TaxID=759811 RepID=UPI003D2CE17C
MKKLIFSAALVLSLGLAGCEEETAKEEPGEKKKTVTETSKEDATKQESSAPVPGLWRYVINLS